MYIRSYYSIFLLGKVDQTKEYRVNEIVFMTRVKQRSLIETLMKRA